MEHEPQIEMLSFRRRNFFFWVLVLIFLISLPALIFYTKGYRLDFSDEVTAIVTTGGVYVNTDNLEMEVYLDEEKVEKPKFFRSAYYIQHIEAGQHKIVVQRPDLHTWVKELPIDSYIVIEASAFNLPKIPHLRPVTKYVTATGTPVYLGLASTTGLFTGVTTTVPVATTLSKRSTRFDLNEEYTFVNSLFSSTSASMNQSVFERILDQFGFSTTSAAEATTSQSLAENGNMIIVERESDLYASWQGSNEDIPYYFCVTKNTLASTGERYGAHVADALARLKTSTTTPLIMEEDRVCRPEIKLNRLRQDVYFYDFFLGSRDLILLQLEDGLYVTEIDDRSWQNTQQIYAGTDFKVVLENNSIFILDNANYFELITEIEPN